jgi:hypothetical protein
MIMMAHIVSGASRSDDRDVRCRRLLLSGGTTIQSHVHVLGGAVVFPLMLLYTLISYSVFRGKIKTTAGQH